MRNGSALFEEKLLDERTLYHQKYGEYLDAMHRDGLNIPTDNTCQWSILCAILFKVLKRKCAGSRLVIRV